MRLSAIFVAVCMTVIAASAGAVVYFAYGLTGVDAIVVAIAALTGLALYNAVSTRMNLKAVVGPQITELSRGNADLARQLAEIGRRLAAVEAKQERASARDDAAIEPLAVEISELGTLVDQLAETVALHETQLGELGRAQAERAKIEAAAAETARLEAARIDIPKADLVQPEAANTNSANRNSTKADSANSEPSEPSAAWLRALLESAPSPAAAMAPPLPMAAEPLPPVTPVPVAAVPPLPILAAPSAPPAPAATVPNPAAVPLPAAPVLASSPEPARNAAQEMPAATRRAIEANRIDLHLQPIVTLPQRKVRFYEAMSRVRTENGDVVMAADFIAQAEAGGLMPTIDNLVVFRCVQVLRRLLLKNREVGVFCNLSMATLTDAVVFPQLLQFLDANRAIAPSLVLEFTQSGLRGAGPIETEGLAALRACGYHFSLDNVTDLRLEPRELANRGFRYVKLKAGLILNRGGLAADIHPGDLPDLLARFGIDLIAERIESEGVVVDLLDYEVKFGQGFLFSPPRPVRAEALQGIAERNDVVARDSSSGELTGAKGIKSAAESKTAGDPESRGGLRSAGLARVVRRI